MRYGEQCWRLRAYGTYETSTEYEVEWKGFGPEHNRWYRMDMLENARDLVDDFEKELKQTDAITHRNREAKRITKPLRKIQERK